MLHVRLRLRACSARMPLRNPDFAMASSSPPKDTIPVCPDEVCIDDEILMLEKRLAGLRKRKAEMHSAVDTVAEPLFTQPRPKTVPTSPASAHVPPGAPAPEQLEDLAAMPSHPKEHEGVRLSSAPASSSPSALSLAGISDLRRSFRRLERKISEMSGVSSMQQKQEPAVEVPMPKVQLTKEAVEWDADSLSMSARRNAWPLGRQSRVDLTAFECFLKSRALSVSSVQIHTQGVCYFFSLFDISEDNFSLAGALATIYIENMTERC